MGLQYPNYKNNVMVAPIIKLTLADLLDEMPGYFSSITMTYPSDSMWESSSDKEVLMLPKFVDITTDFVPLYHEIPSSTEMAHIDGIRK